MSQISINAHRIAFLWWDQMSLLVRIDLIVLGLLLAYTIAAVLRISRQYRRDPDIDRATRRTLAAQLNIWARNLDSIATVAPYLGLLGTCLGILGAFTGFGMERQAAMAALSSSIAGALVPTAAGIIVALSATCAHQYACARLDSLGAELPPGKLHLTERLTLPSFGIIAVYALVIVFRGYAPLASIPSPRGLDVRMAPKSCDLDSDRSIVLRISSNGRLFLNFEEEQDWKALQNHLSDIYARREQRVLYLLADQELQYQTVADAIDKIENTSEAGTLIPLNITIELITPRALNAVCPEPVPRRRPRHSLK